MPLDHNNESRVYIIYYSWFIKQREIAIVHHLKNLKFRERIKRKMQNLKSILEKWEKLVDKYDKESTKLQKKISDILKLEWTTNNSRSETDLKKFIDRSG